MKSLLQAIAIPPFLMCLSVAAQDTADEPAESVPRVPLQTINNAIPSSTPSVAPPNTVPPSSATPTHTTGSRYNVHPIQQDPATAAAVEQSNQVLRDKRATLEAQRQVNTMDPDTKSAWDRWSSDSGYSNISDVDARAAAKKRDFLQLQRDWEQVQVEAHKGNITPDQNSKFLNAHANDLGERYSRAAEKSGLQAREQKASGPKKGFSDTDLHAFPEGTKEAAAAAEKAGKSGDWKPGQKGQMSVEQFEAARQQFDAEFNRDLKNAGLAEVPSTVDGVKPNSPSRQMRVDLMPITEDKALFQQVEEYINKQGGVMYQCTNAVCQEVANRQSGTNAQGQTPAEATSSATKADYANEQVRQQRAHVAEANHMRDEGVRLVEEANAVRNNPNSTPEQLRQADANFAEGQRRLELSQGEGSSLVGKYEDRANQLVNTQANQAGVDGVEVSPRRQTAIDDVGGTRDHTVTQQSADIIATNENSIRNQQTEGARAMAADGNLSDAAEMGRNAANANTKGEILQAAREGSLQRHRERIANQYPDLSPEDIDAAANAAANRDTALIAEEMRTQAPDVHDPMNNRSNINQNPNRGLADGKASANAASQQAMDMAAIEAAREARMTSGQRARRVAGNAANMVDAAAFGAQIGDAAIKQGGKAIDENRDIEASDLGEAALEISGIPGMYALGNRVSREVLIEVQEGRIPPHQAMDEIKIRLAAEVGNAVLVAPVQQAIEQEWAAAEREGREPSYVSAAGNAAVEVGGNVTGARQLGDAYYDSYTWEARADAAAQAAALDQQLESDSRLTDKNIARLQRELEDLSLNGDLSDPATLATIQAHQQALREANDKMERIRDAANRNADRLSPETLSSVNGLARSQTRPEDMEDYIDQNLRARGATEEQINDGFSEIDLADEFAQAGQAEAGSWQGSVSPEAAELTDEFASADEVSQVSRGAQRTLSRDPGRVEVTDLSEVWAAEDIREVDEQSQRVGAARAAQDSLDASWNSTMSRVDSNATAQTQQGQAQLTAAQQQGQAAVAAAASQADPRMSQQDFNDQRQQLDDEADQLAQQRDQILSGGASGAGNQGPVDPNKGGQYGGAAIAQAANGDETGFDQRQASCDDVVKSGGNAPAAVAINGSGFGGSATLTWDHYGVKDRIAVLAGGAVVFDSGCVPNKGNSPITVSGQIKVIVEPNCEQTSSSAWEFKVMCNAAVAQQ